MKSLVTWWKQANDKLKGKRTYIGMGIATVYAILCIWGFAESNELVWTLIAAWTGFSWRAASNS